MKLRVTTKGFSHVMQLYVQNGGAHGFLVFDKNLCFLTFYGFVVYDFEIFDHPFLRALRRQHSDVK